MPFLEFPPQFLRITCDRCGKGTMLNKAHTTGRQREILLRDLLARTPSRNRSVCWPRARATRRPPPARRVATTAIAIASSTNEKLRKVIDTTTSKVVLILGRFTEERKAVLDALRAEVRKHNYLPVIFDFEKSASRTTDETITLMARMARFVIADLSDAKSVLQELRGVVPDLPSVPVQPLILASQDEPGMFDFFRSFPWVLTTHRYASEEQLIADLAQQVIGQAEAKFMELQGPRSR